MIKISRKLTSTLTASDKFLFSSYALITRVPVSHLSKTLIYSDSYCIVIR